MILIVDDDKAVRLSLSVSLRHSGYEVMAVEGADEALAAVRARCPDLVIMDMNFGGGTDGADGLALLQRVKVLCPGTPVILITAWGSIPLAVEGVKLGAFDFMTKPWNPRLLVQRVATALEIASPTEKSSFERPGIIGRSAALTALLDMAARIAPTDASVLITGENGTGKELLARAIHENSIRRKGPFVAVNLGGIPQSLFESEMFGHVRGAFTGAVGERKGRFELADGGTIFLDEIGELDINSQVKLLRVLQEHTFEPLGDSRPRRTDIRVICATNADLPAMMAERTFREDLYYRINTITMRMPSLAERRDDIPLLVRHFAVGLSAEFSPEAMEVLRRLPYPGNIRQLKSIVSRAAYIAAGPSVSADDVRRAADSEPIRQSEAPSGSIPEKRTLEEIERDAVADALRRHPGNLSAAAASLGITRQLLYRRMEKFGFEP